MRLPHTTILNRLQWQFKTFPYSKTETTGVFKTALTFVDSVSEIWGPLLNGLSVLVIPKAVTLDPERLVSVLEKYKVGIESSLSLKQINFFVYVKLCICCRLNVWYLCHRF